MPGVGPQRGFPSAATGDAAHRETARRLGYDPDASMRAAGARRTGGSVDGTGQDQGSSPEDTAARDARIAALFHEAPQSRWAATLMPASRRS